MADEFTITGQRQTTALGRDGHFREMMEVSFEVAGIGVTGSIDVAMFEYTPARVHELVSERVAAIKQVHNL